LPPASPNSWALAQRQRRQREEALAASAAEDSTGAAPSDEEIMRRVKSTLNKLTPEKFSTLYTKLMQCGIDENAHMELLAQTICEEAISQSNFAGMYADLCTYMLGDLSPAGGTAFAEAIHCSCMKLLEHAAEQPPCAAAAAQERDHAADGEQEETQALRKRRALGNVRFMGELLVRCFFSPDVLFDCTDRLVKAPSSESRLEMLAVILNVVGPAFDTAIWPRHADLVQLFWHVRGLMCDMSISKRVRCLFRDVVELRDEGWVEGSVGRKAERPMTLEEVRSGTQHEASFAPFAEWVALADFGSELAYGQWDFDDCGMQLSPDFNDGVGMPVFPESLGEDPMLPGYDCCQVSGKEDPMLPGFDCCQISGKEEDPTLPGYECCQVSHEEDGNGTYM